MEKEIRMDKKEFEELLSGVAKGAMESEIKRLGLDKVDRKFGMFPGSAAGMSEEELAKLDKSERVVKFFRAVFQKDMAGLAALSVKAMNEGTGSAGGFLVPEEFRNDVMRIVEDFGLVGKMATRIPMGTDTMNVPRLSASVSVTYPGEATAGTESQPTLEQVQLLAKTAVGLTPMSNELLADANVDVVALLKSLFAEAIAGAMDNQAFNGTGSPFTGILTDSGVTVVTGASGDDTFDEASTPDYARQLIAQIKPWALAGAGFFMHRGRWSVMQQKKASSGGDYFASAANPVITVGAVQAPGQPAGTLWGYPVYLTDKLTNTTAVSTKFLVFGNLKHILWGDRQQMAVSMSDSATLTTAGNLFEKNMSAVRVVDRHAIAVGLPAAFAVLKTAAS